MAAPRIEPRRVLIFYHGDTLRCFNGHTLDLPVVLEHGVVPCRKPMGDGRGRNDSGQCNQLLYFFGGIKSPTGEPGGVLVTEITTTEMRLLDRSQRTPREVLRFLGLAL